MPINPDMGNVMNTMHQMQSAHAQQIGILSGSINSLQQTISQLAEATRIGVGTAISSGSQAMQTLQMGTATAISDVQAIGGAIAGAMGGPSAAPMIGGPSVGFGRGLSPAGAGMIHGAAVGVGSIAGTLGGFGAWAGISAAMTAGGVPWLGAGAAFSGSRAAIGGGRIAAGIGLGGAGIAAGAAAIALPLAGALAVEHVASVGLEHLSAVRDVNAIIGQNAARLMPFDPNVASPELVSHRGLARQIVGDVARVEGIGRGGAAAFVGQAMDLGLFTGAGAEGPEGIRQRARELAEAVRDTAKLLGSSIEEGLQIMSEVRQTGFAATDAPGIITASRGRARFGGFTAAEMHMVGLQGAQRFRGLGMTQFGFNAAQMDLATVSNLVETGQINNQLVASMGGRQAMAGALTANLADFTQSPLAMTMLAAGGPGGIQNFQQLASQAGMNISQMNMAERLAFLGGGAQRLTEQLGPEGMRGFQLQTLLMSVQGNPMLSQQFRGMSQEQQQDILTQQAINMNLAQGRNEARALAIQAMNPQTFEQQALAMKAERHREAMDREMADTGVSGWFRRRGQDARDAGSWFGDAVSKPVNDLSDFIDNQKEDFTNWLNGTQRTQVSERNIGMISHFTQMAFQQQDRARATTADVEASARFRALGLTETITRGELEERVTAGEDLVQLAGGTAIFAGDPAAGDRVARAAVAAVRRGRARGEVVDLIGRAGIVNVITRTNFDIQQNQAALIQEAVGEDKDMTKEQRKAINKAIDIQMFGGRGGKRIINDDVKMLMDPDVPIADRAAALQTIAERAVIGVYGTGDAYDNIPGNTVHEKMAHVMVGMREFDPKAWNEVAKTTQTHAPDTEAITFLADQLDEKLGKAAAAAFGVGDASDTSRNQRMFIQQNAVMLEDLARGKLTPEESLRVGRLLKREGAEGDARAIAARVRRERGLFQQTATVVGAAETLVAQKRFTEDVTADIAGLRETLQERGVLRGNVALTLSEIEQAAVGPGGAAALAQQITQLRGTEREALSAIQKGGGFVAGTIATSLANDSKGEAEITNMLMRRSGIIGNRLEFMDPEQRQRVSNQERVSANFSRVNETITINLSAAKDLAELVKEVKAKQTASWF